MPTFKALFVTENTENQRFSQQIVHRNTEDLPAGEVLVRVKFSSLNYKDALSATGNRGVTRNYPHTPGIDASGVVEESSSLLFQKGQKILVTSYDLGMNTSGGFGQYIRVPAQWLIKLPKGLSLKQAMQYGTGGLTAALGIEKLLKNGLKPQDGKVLVTGSTGGVGCMAVAILCKLGFETVAVTGKPEAHQFLKNIGASEIIGREALLDTSNRSLLKAAYAAAIDTVGGQTLATILKSIQPNGAVVACGLVQSPDLPTSVFPFILRGISLFGVDSATCPMDIRLSAWKKLAKSWKPSNLDSMTKTVALGSLSKEIKKILQAGQVGRVVVRL